MKKIFVIIVFTLLYTSNIFGQAAVDIPLSATDGSGGFSNLWIGLDLSATTCIDSALGEYVFNVMPPAGVFDSRLDLAPYGCGTIFTLKDYRPPGDPPIFPFTGIIEHTLAFQTTALGIPIDITYDLPYGTYMRITDRIGGIFLNIGPFFGQGIATIPGSYTTIFSKAILKMYYNNIGGTPTPDPVFLISSDSLNFGSVNIGLTKTLPISITNIGYEDSLYIFDAVSSNPAFTINPNVFPVIISPTATEVFNITYSANPGTHNDSILFIHNADGSPEKLKVIANTYEPHQECQAMIQDKVIVSNGIFSNWLRFGLDSTGTDGIDSHLGESDLPPFPPPDVFEARFFLPENNFWGSLSSYCDFRGAIFPYTGQKEWRLAFQPGSGNTIIISWDFPSYLSGVLQDIINGSFINVLMVDSGSFTVQNPYVFNKLRMLIDFNIEIPVELISFASTLIDNNVKLGWITATETNNSGFEIQRTSPLPSPYQGEGVPTSRDGRDWEKIGFLPGFGTSSEPKSYSFIDENVSSGNYKYRLKQIDFDGTSTYSKEIEVEVDFTPKEFVLYQNYPNPFNPTTIIKYRIPLSPPLLKGESEAGGFVSLKVYDVLGNKVATLVNEEKLVGEYEVEWNASEFPSGIYVYQMNAGSFISIKKMVLLK